MEEINNVNNGSVVEDMGTDTDYIQAINELKQNSVSRDQFNKVKEDNKKLLNALVNGQSIEAEVVKPVDIDSLRKELFNGEKNNLEYVTKALELRTALVDAGERDPFLPYGHKVVPTDEDITCANRVATVLQECVDYADGDSEVFTSELMRRTVDTGLPKNKNRR